MPLPPSFCVSPLSTLCPLPALLRPSRSLRSRSLLSLSDSLFIFENFSSSQSAISFVLFVFFFCLASPCTLLSLLCTDSVLSSLSLPFSCRFFFFCIATSRVPFLHSLSSPCCILLPLHAPVPSVRTDARCLCSALPRLSVPRAWRDGRTAVLLYCVAFPSFCQTDRKSVV